MTKPSKFCRRADGSITACPIERERIWVDAYKAQMCYHKPKSVELAAIHKAKWEAYKLEVARIRSNPENRPAIDGPITYDEVVDAIRHTNKGKAQGPRPRHHHI